MWEKIEDNNFIVTQRMKVPGGWIVRSLYSDAVSSIAGPAITCALHQLFIEDVEHSWEIEK